MDVQGISIIIGAFLPVVIDFLNKYVKNSNWRYVASLVISLLVGGIIAFAAGDLTGVSVLSAGAIVFASAQTIYKTYWSGSAARVKLYGKTVLH